MMRNESINVFQLILFLILIMLIAIGCGEENCTDCEPEPDIKTEATIGTEGGTLEIEDSNSPIQGFRLTIPPNALEHDTTLSIEIVSPPVDIPNSSIGPVIKLLPENTVFNKPIEVQWKYSNSEIPNNKNEEDIGIITKVSENNWIPHSIDYLDTNSNTIAYSTKHFSFWSKEIRLNLIDYSTSNPPVFDKNPILYYIDSASFENSNTSLLLYKIPIALSMWENAGVGINFEETDEDVNADVKFIQVSEWSFSELCENHESKYYDYNPVECRLKTVKAGSAEATAWAYEWDSIDRSKRSVNIYFYDFSPTTPSEPGGYDQFLKVVLHETGHALGLPHDQFKCSGYNYDENVIMSQGEPCSIDKPIILSINDKSNLQSLYFEYPIDSDNDGIYDDGNFSGSLNDSPCGDTQTVYCDDNCIYDANSAQTDSDSNGIGNICEDIGIENGLVAYYPFNDLAIDESGNGNHGVVYGDTNFSGNVANFDGNGDYIKCDENTDLDGFTSFSISLLITPNEDLNSSTDRIDFLYKGPYISTSQTYNVSYSDNPGHFSTNIRRFNRTSAGFNIIYGKDFSAGQTFHYAITYDGDAEELFMYVNGQKVGTIGGDLSVGGDIYNNSYPLTIGSNSDYRHFFNGALDEIRIYDRALTSSEVQSLSTQDGSQ